MIEALEDAYAERWTTTHELLRINAMQTNTLMRLYHRVHFEGDPPAPLVIRRPGEHEPEAAKPSLAEVARMHG